MPELTKQEQSEKLGKELIELLGLSFVSEDQHVYTNGGTKTALGLGRTVERIIQEIKQGA